MPSVVNVGPLLTCEIDFHLQRNIDGMTSRNVFPSTLFANLTYFTSLYPSACTVGNLQIIESNVRKLKLRKSNIVTLGSPTFDVLIFFPTDTAKREKNCIEYMYLISIHNISVPDISYKL